MRTPVTPPPYVPSQGVLDAIGNAIAQALGVGINSHQVVQEEQPHVPQGTRSCRARPQSRTRPRAESDPSRTVVDGRWGACVFTGNCASIIKQWDPKTMGLPSIIFFDYEMEVWGRRWVVKASTLGERHGYGVFACEDTGT